MESDFIKLDLFDAVAPGGRRLFLISDGAAVYKNGERLITIKRQAIPQCSGRILNNFTFLSPLSWDGDESHPLKDATFREIVQDVRSASRALGSDAEIYRELQKAELRDGRVFKKISQYEVKDDSGILVDISSVNSLAYHDGQKCLRAKRCEGFLPGGQFYIEVQFEAPLNWENEPRLEIGPMELKRICADIAAALRDFRAQAFFYVHETV